LSAANEPYVLFPFQFGHFSGNRMLLVNDAGEFIFLAREDFDQLISGGLDPASPVFLDLKGKNMATDTAVAPMVDLLATKYRTKRQFLTTFTGLHIVVVTLRCNQRCNYCHASSVAMDQNRWDMTPQTALQVARTIMETPSPMVKIEYQGGEPLLNLEVIKIITREAKKINRRKQKDLSFVVCTNLTLMDEPTLEYLKEEEITISTSLDGPREIHDRHRLMRTDEGSYDRFMEKLQLSRSIVGHEHVNALMTISAESLAHLPEIIDEYARNRFPGVFLRHINPYGYARSEAHRESFDYPMEEFIAAYKDVLFYIIELNLKGIRLVESFTTLLLSRILTPFATGFVDLQSPAGTGITGVVYDFNGDVYPSDEGRMLAKMGDRRFWMGNVNRDSYLSIFRSPVIEELVEVSCVETIPGCHSCVLQTFCGCDPVRNYAVQGDLVGHRATSDFCKKHKEIITFLLEVIDRNDPNVMEVFWSWITNRSLEEVRGEPPCLC
jgi:His-Xaa-Ser system radical SAM maturase HxsB